MSLILTPSGSVGRRERERDREEKKPPSMVVDVGGERRGSRSGCVVDLGVS